MLREVLNKLGYADKTQQLALIKLAAYSDCFDENYKEKIISDEDANLLLNSTEFKSVEEGMSWFCSVTQEKWLRSTFHQEGLKKVADLSINVARWQQENKQLSSDLNGQLLNIFNNLNLLSTVSWPETKVAHVVVHGGMSEHTEERINFIKEFSGNLYYITNPRGLFNNEKELAPILANWFGKPEAVDFIQRVLDKNKDPKTSKKNWLNDLNALKKEILTELNVKEWPKGKGWYYQGTQVFEESSKNDKRQSLADWPTAMDMIEYQLRKHMDPKNIKLCPVYAYGKDRVANTEDLIKAFYEQHASSITKETLVVFVSNNSKGLHYISYQDCILKTTLMKLNLSAKNAITVGPGEDKNVNLYFVLDALARTIFHTINANFSNVMQDIHAKKQKALPSVAGTLSHQSTLVVNSVTNDSKLNMLSKGTSNSIWERAKMDIVWSAVNKEKLTQEELNDALSAIDAIVHVKEIISHISQEDREPFVRAVNRCGLKTIYFNEDIDINLDTKRNGLTALMVACFRGHQEIAMKLINARVGLDIQHPDLGINALIIATNEGLDLVIDKLIEAKADLNIKDNKGNTALTHACLKNKTNIACKLIQAGTYLKSNNDIVFRTLEIVTCCHENLTIIAMLIKYGSIQHPIFLLELIQESNKIDPLLLFIANELYEYLNRMITVDPSEESNRLFQRSKLLLNNQNIVHKNKIADKIFQELSKSNINYSLSHLVADYLDPLENYNNQLSFFKPVSSEKMAAQQNQTTNKFPGGLNSFV